MFIKLLPIDIPRYWDVIKWACVQAEEVDSVHMAAYCRSMLVALLCDDAQAWLRLDENRKIVLVCVTRILLNKELDEKYLHMQVGYSWKRQEEGVWARDAEVLRQFAATQGCKYVGTMSRNPRIWELMLKNGFVESTRIFAQRI